MLIGLLVVQHAQSRIKSQQMKNEWAFQKDPGSFKKLLILVLGLSILSVEQKKLKKQHFVFICVLKPTRDNGNYGFNDCLCIHNAITAWM